jgi:hypothetical protein
MLQRTSIGDSIPLYVYCGAFRSIAQKSKVKTSTRALRPWLISRIADDKENHNLQPKKKKKETEKEKEKKN